jgi:hypothetical protein
MWDKNQRLGKDAKSLVGVAKERLTLAGLMLKVAGAAVLPLRARVGDAVYDGRERRVISACDRSQASRRLSDTTDWQIANPSLRDKSVDYPSLSSAPARFGNSWCCFGASAIGMKDQ